jgi:3-dehydroquinate dehydratase-1
METRSDRINAPLPGRKPRIVGVIASRTDWDLVTQGDFTGLDLCELRVDLLAAEGFEERECQRPLPFSKILTIRDPKEGGRASLGEKERVDLFARLLPHVDYIDLELRNFSLYAEVIAAARTSEKQVILSVHDFEKTPNEKEMERWVEETMLRDPNAILKISTQVTSWEEVVRLGNFLANQSRIKVAAMGMGPWGKVSRLLFARLGSELIYAACGELVVPGQWDFRTLRSILPHIVGCI